MKKIKHIITSTLSCLLALSVILSCVHAKDLATYRTKTPSAGYVSDARATDIVAKVLGELHTHVDKTALKAMVKSVSDQTVYAYGRELRLYGQRYSRTTATVLTEMLLMLRIALAAGSRA